MLRVGDLVPTHNIRAYFGNPKTKSWGVYKAEKSKHMVFLYLGQEPKDGTKNIDPSKVLKKLGWTIISH